MCVQETDFSFPSKCYTRFQGSEMRQVDSVPGKEESGGYQAMLQVLWDTSESKVDNSHRQSQI